MENYAEKKTSSTEKSNENNAAEQENPLYKMFVTQLSQLHTVCAEEALARGFGQANLGTKHRRDMVCRPSIRQGLLLVLPHGP